METNTNKYEDANHQPIAVLNGDNTRQMLNIKTTAGSIIELSAFGSNDPDGDSVTYSWLFYEEPSSYKGTLSIQNSSSLNTKLEIPNDANGKIMHIILEIHDNGSPKRYTYCRIIVSIVQ
jgi:hypothetical protein